MANVNKTLKICCGLTTLFIILLLVVLIVLFLTLFKPKQPKINAHPVSLENFLFGFPSFKLNLTLGLVVTIENPNYGSFKYKDSKASIIYHGDVVGEAPIEAGVLHPHSKQDISTSVVLIADKVISSPYFPNDALEGSLNMTSSLTLHGKVGLFKIIKLSATGVTKCDISIHLVLKTIDSSCKSKVKI